MTRITFSFLCLLGGIGSIPAQVFQPVFPGLNGPALTDSVVSRYKPLVILDYANARDTLYAKVLATDDDSLRCIYSGHTLYLDPTQDPTQYVYLNGISLGMNTEHAYPQAKGAAEGNPRSDMHHLFPARIPVNEARANSPYTEIPDAQTQQWFYKAQVLFSVPAQNKELYSESKNNAFEPRESVKGDLARAVFYFYTMYRSQADAADPAFFAAQRATLCQWHWQDPADSAELIKTWRIAPYQEDKPNPFILDCTLARRIYCPEVPENCATTAVNEPDGGTLGLRLMPNPWPGAGQVEMTLPFAGDVELRLRTVLGKELVYWRVQDASKGMFRMQIENPLPVVCQTALLEVVLSGSHKISRQTIPVFILP